MTPINPLKAAAPIVCAAMTASCAASPPISPVAPVRLPPLPQAATQPCALATLPSEPTVSDLDAAYLLRGAQLQACDGARRLAVDALLAERRANMPRTKTR